jgi:proteasome lid subunit RPN8/RPN11
MVEAEQLTREARTCQIDVIGWYHSHPNITVFPSQVDINTQYIMQTIGRDFIGLIFSVFVGSTGCQQSSSLSKHLGKTELIAFQSYEDTKDGVFKARTIKVKIVDSKFL